MKIIIGIGIALLCASSSAFADDPSKDQCVDAHSRGQDAKTQGQLTLAKKLFLSCAQAGCPALVQSDCARFADELARLQPSISLAARDGGGADLPDTTVYIDDALVATRLDDGRPHDVDPGKHVVRFTHGGREQVVTVVVGSGEQSRAVVGVFAAPGTHESRQPSEVTTHPSGAKLAIGAGLGLVVAGAAVGVWGYLQVPGNCAIGTHQCAAPPGDPVFDRASSGMQKLNLGMIAGGAGLAVIAGGLVWYITGGKSSAEVTPFTTAGGAGISFSGSL